MPNTVYTNILNIYDLKNIFLVTFLKDPELIFPNSLMVSNFAM